MIKYRASPIRYGQAPGFINGKSPLNGETTSDSSPAHQQLVRRSMYM